jgi:type III secretory pathway component EscR
MILADGTEVTDLSVPSLKKHMKGMGIETWNIIIIRKSTGEQFEVQAVEDIFPEGFDELRKKVKMEGTATQEEIDEFKAMWEEVRDGFLTLPDWELFEGISEPFPVGGAVFLGFLVVGLIIGGVSLSRGRRR